ncbi:MAG: excinuclease ABC subunit UvrA [Candidatus Altiarchaeota archaeon]|nr:excinuclease ABC subunit UvrA [Candidatus Altiarchaeota archaeon]
MQKNLIIKGAREHNLRNVSVTLPRDRLMVFSGLSGSGKSTLAFDTIYAEGQRRYVESLSSYARQFLGLMNKPDVDGIEGLSPAISIEQKTTSKNPRSTVGTVTEIYDYLRLFFARLGTPYCPEHNVRIASQTPERITESIAGDFSGELLVLAPIVRQKKGTYEKLLSDLNKEGFVRARINKKIVSTEDKPNLDRYRKHDIEVVVDRLDPRDKSRLAEAAEAAEKKSGGLVIALDAKSGKEKLYSSLMACPVCGLTFEELQPRMFSFNSPFGACEECEGLGIKMEFDPDLVIPDNEKSIAEGGIAAFGSIVDGWRLSQLASVAKKFRFSMIKPIKELPEEALEIILHGTEKDIKYEYNSRDGDSSYTYYGGFEGVIPMLERLYKQTESEGRREWMQRFMRVLPCPACEGKRLKRKVLAVKVEDRSIIDVTDLSVKDCLGFFRNLTLTEKEEKIAKQLRKEIIARLAFLEEVGLGYLTLSRAAGTLSGGEGQRIRLATQIGSNLTGVLYVLDEPSIGLHQRDNHKLIETLLKLRDLGNTLIVVEHDEDTIRAADWVVDIGPGAGIHGGKIVFEGTPESLLKDERSLTGKYMSGRMCIETPEKRRPAKGSIGIKNAREHNLKGIDVDIPAGCLTLVTGVSGSGKSTLVYDILYKALMGELHGSKEPPGKHDKVIFDGLIDKVLVIDQSPIGRTPRSNPATYTKVFDEIRKLFAETPEAKVRGYKPGRFSFNLKGGRCEACEGDGVIKIEMNFLPDVYVECEECKGRRYNRETLEVKYKGKNIAEVLSMTVEEALKLFENVPSVRSKLATLNAVGLEYISLGQSSTTLSGGESQRIKLTRELSKKATGKTLYLLDEPTTGLHFHDVKKLLSVLNRLADKGNTVVVIEHNLDVIKSADYIIDLGPEGGDSGGEIIAHGTPEEVMNDKKSHTGRYLKKHLERNKRCMNTRT